MAEEDDLILARTSVPKTPRLVVPDGEQPAPVEAGRHVAHPVGVAAQRLDAVARRDVPDAERGVARRGDEEVAGQRRARRAGGDEAHRRDGMVVARQRADVLVRVVGVPELDGEVSGAGREQGAATGPPIVDVQYRLGVALDGALQLAQLPVPDLDGRVFGARGQRGEDRVEGDAVDGQPVAGEDVPGWGAREPGCRVVVAAREGGWGCGVEFGLEGGVAGFEVEDLWLVSWFAVVVRGGEGDESALDEAMPFSVAGLRPSISSRGCPRISCWSPRQSCCRR